MQSTSISHLISEQIFYDCLDMTSTLIDSGEEKGIKPFENCIQLYLRSYKISTNIFLEYAKASGGQQRAARGGRQQ